MAVILRDQNILIHGIPHTPVQFDLQSLEQLGRIDREMLVHGEPVLHPPHVFSDVPTSTAVDFSIPVPNDSSNIVRGRTGTPQDLLDTLNATHPKALNGLDFPLSDDPFGPQKFSSDGVSWQWTMCYAFCPRDEHKPISDIRWGLAATSGAFHEFHVDTAGFGTFIAPDVGTKLWVPLSPKHQLGGRPFDFLGRTQVFYENFNISLPPPGDWVYDLVVLQPGMKL